MASGVRQAVRKAVFGSKITKFNITMIMLSLEKAFSGCQTDIKPSFTQVFRTLFHEHFCASTLSSLSIKCSDDTMFSSQPRHALPTLLHDCSVSVQHPDSLQLLQMQPNRAMHPGLWPSNPDVYSQTSSDSIVHDVARDFESLLLA